MNKSQLQEKLLYETKYSRWYLNIVENVQLQNRKKLKKINEDYIYYENHHILPKSIFKEYKDLKKHKWNSVLLTAKEHFICHMCLAKHYKNIKYTLGEMKMSKPLKLMSVNGKYNSNAYQHFKLNLSHTEKSKEKMKGRKGWNKGKPLTELHKENLRISKKNISQTTRNKLSKLHKGKTISEAHKKKISEAGKGRKHTDEAKKKIGEANKLKIGNKNHMFGKKHTSESILKMKKPKGEQKIFTCPKCGKEGGISLMKRWHGIYGEKCK